MYLLKSDVELLNDWLNNEDEIAFLVPNGSKKWIAKKQYDILADSNLPNQSSIYQQYSLWHVPSGSLPLLGSNRGFASLIFNEKDSVEEKITDPWNGWTEARTGANPNRPYFGPGHPGVFQLDIKLFPDGEIPISGIQWIGNHYKIIGNGADKSTEFFWNKMRRMAKKIATQIPRCNDGKGRNEIFAFPNAYEEIKNGRPCSLN